MPWKPVVNGSSQRFICNLAPLTLDFVPRRAPSLEKWLKIQIFSNYDALPSQLDASASICAAAIPDELFPTRKLIHDLSTTSIDKSRCVGKNMF